MRYYVMATGWMAGMYFAGWDIYPCPTWAWSIRRAMLLSQREAQAVVDRIDGRYGATVHALKVSADRVDMKAC